MKKSCFVVVLLIFCLSLAALVLADTDTATACDANLNCDFMAADGKEYYCSLETGTCFSAEESPSAPLPASPATSGNATPAFDPRIPALQATVATLQQDVGTLDNDIKQVQNNLNTLQSQLSALQQQFTELSATFDGFSQIIKQELTPRLSEALVAQAALQEELNATQANLGQVQENLKKEQSFTKFIKVSFLVLLVLAIALGVIYYVNRQIRAKKKASAEIKMYITRQIKQGKKFFEIKEALSSAGWQESDVAQIYKDTIKQNYQEYKQQKTEAAVGKVGYDKRKIISVAVLSGLLVFGILFLLTGALGKAFFAFQTVSPQGEVGLKVECTPPQILTPNGQSCCTDENKNGLCDIAERVVEPSQNNVCHDNLQCPTKECINTQCASLSQLYKGSSICDKRCNFYAVRIRTSDGETYNLKPGQGSYTAAGALQWTLEAMPTHCIGERATIPILVSKKEPGKVLGEEYIALQKGQSSKVINHPSLPEVHFTMRVVDVREICE